MIDVLAEMADSYERTKPNDFVGRVRVRIGEDDAYLVVLAEETVTVHEATVDDDWTVSLDLSEETFEKLAAGKWNGLTAAGRESMSDDAPLDFRVPDDAELEGETLQLLYHFLTHFFGREHPTVTRLGRSHARTVHGGNAVPIAYGHGVRYAYYTIREGEQINEDEADPWDQIFTVVRGSGIALVDGERIGLEENVAVHVPPGSTHRIRCGDDADALELLWVAYGEGA
jgi:quercetin dioxygenase-like cupin family protein